MHELSVAMGIVALAENEIRKANKQSVEVIELQIGSLSGVELDFLDYVWETAVKGTVLENAEKKIDFVKALAKCLECDTVFNMDFIYDSCPKCNSYFKDIIKGRELKVTSLEVV
jgi:hydrogenase nickel incorporation protein HypA/HybF